MMGRLIESDKLKADLEKAILENGDMDCLDFLRIASLIDAQPTAYDVDEVVEQLEKEKQTSTSAKAEAIIGMCGASANYYGGEECAYQRAIEIVKGGGVADPCAECIEAGGCPIREDCPNEGKKKSKSDKVVEQLEELRKECEDPLQEYNPNYFIDKAIEIAKGGGVDAN
jgi:hypothetical protein